MAKNWLAYSIVTITLLIFIFLRELPMTYWALYAVLLAPILSLLFSLISQRGFSLTAELPSAYVEKGEQAPYTLSIKNRSFLPYSCVRFRFQTDDIAPIFDHDEWDVSVPSRKSDHITVHVNADYRGNYQISPKEIFLYDFLGLFRWKKHLPSPLCLTVLPCVHPLPSLPLEAEVRDMAMERNRISHEDYSAVPDLKKYQPPDGYRKIHWKASAKRNELISKHFRETEFHTAFLCIDNSRINAPQKEALTLEDQMMDALVSAMAQCTERGYTLTLDHMAALAPEPERDIKRLFQTAAQLEFEESGDFDTYLSAFLHTHRGRKNLILFLQNITPSTVSALQSQSTSRQNVTVFHFGEAEAPLLAELQKAGVNCIDFCSVTEKEMPYEDE